MEPNKRRRVDEKLYIAIHKPTGFVSSAKSQHKGQKTIYDLLKSLNFPTSIGLCGRLDSETSGIMLFTNDSVIQRELLIPEEEEENSINEGEKHHRKENWKEYHLTVLASPHRRWGTNWNKNIEDGV